MHCFRNTHGRLLLLAQSSIEAPLGPGVPPPHLHWALVVALHVAWSTVGELVVRRVHAVLATCRWAHHCGNGCAGALLLSLGGVEVPLRGWLLALATTTTAAAVCRHNVCFQVATPAVGAGDAAAQ